MEAKSVYAVIFAGGVGSRMSGAKIPKQFLKQGGRTIISHTLSHFQSHPMVNGIVVACVEEWIPFMQTEVDANQFDKVLSIVAGGGSGQDSIFNGLKELEAAIKPLDDDIVLVHDGVRPLVDKDTISACIDSVKNYGSTATVSASTETVIYEKAGKVVDVLDRSVCRFARAPQGFKFREFYTTHLKAQKDGRHDYIDSISLMDNYGYEIHTITGPEENIKITTPRDYFTFKAYMDMDEIRQIWE